MFNSIQDAILLVQEMHIKFMNSFAGGIYKDSTIGEDHESEIDIPYFYFF